MYDLATQEAISDFVNYEKIQSQLKPNPDEHSPLRFCFGHTYSVPTRGYGCSGTDSRFVSDFEGTILDSGEFLRYLHSKHPLFPFKMNIFHDRDPREGIITYNLQKGSLSTGIGYDFIDPNMRRIPNSLKDNDNGVMPDFLRDLEAAIQKAINEENAKKSTEKK